jgi:ATP-dependent Clp protease protease subunit
MFPNLPAATLDKLASLRAEISPRALERWNQNVNAAAPESAGTISIFDEIGVDPYTGEGTSAKRIGAALRQIGEKNPVTVYINSPGGSMFEGLAIHSLLREHKGEVTVKVLGVAASAASLVAMAGDRLEIARSGFLMIHNAWVMAVGNRNDLRAYADTLEPFDRAMADLYAERTGVDLEKIAAMMDGETWIGGSEAVDTGFADSLLAADEVSEGDAPRAEVIAARRLDMALARAGMPRSERRDLIQKIKADKPCAVGGGEPALADHGTRDAAIAVQKALDAINEIKGIFS